MGAIVPLQHIGDVRFGCHDKRRSRATKYQSQCGALHPFSPQTVQSMLEQWCWKDGTDDRS
jgi:hypothetical protein